MSDSQYTHSIWIHVGRRRWGWDCTSEANAYDVWKKRAVDGIVTRTPTGRVTIIPPWQITKIEIKPIVRRRKRNAAVQESSNDQLELSGRN